MLQAPLLLRRATYLSPLHLVTRAYASISCTAVLGPFYRVVALTFVETRSDARTNVPKTYTVTCIEAP